MAQYTKVVQADGTWRLFDGNGNPVGRIWLTAHIDRILRDGDLADGVAAAIALTGAANRRQAARAAFAIWQTAGGHSVDFASITISPNNDAGVPDDNRHIYIAGNELGYIHGDAVATHILRLARFVRLAEEAWSAAQLGTQAEQNAALDATMTRFQSDGGLTLR